MNGTWKRTVTVNYACELLWRNSLRGANDVRSGIICVDWPASEMKMKGLVGLHRGEVESYALNKETCKVYIDASFTLTDIDRRGSRRDARDSILTFIDQNSRRTWPGRR